MRETQVNKAESHQELIFTEAMPSYNIFYS